MIGSPAHNLLVPVTVDALALGHGAKGRPHPRPWSQLAPDFERKYANGSVLGYQQLPSWDGLWNFSSPGCPYRAGIHLRWALPDGLTRGRPSGSGGSPTGGSLPENGAPQYPAVPNRWLVVRMFAGNESPKRLTPEVAAWLVESDFATVDPPAEVSAAAQWPVFPAPGQALPHQDAVRYVGRAILLTDSTAAGSPESGGTYLKSPLTALGWGDPTFAAFYPMSNGVFGFHDPLESFTSSPQQQHIFLTYFVAGWYADPSYDPLFGRDTAAAWEARLAELEWTWPDASGSRVDSPSSPSSPDSTLPHPLPQRTLYHGMVARVDWQGASHDYSRNVFPDTSNIDVAVADNSIAALAALVAKEVVKSNPRQDPARIEDLLIAFQSDLLAAYESGTAEGTIEAELEQARHRGAFAFKPGGTIWEIRLKDGASHESGLPGQGQSPPAVPLPSPLGPLLTKINELQRRHDAAARIFTSLQQRYFMTWHKQADGLAESPGWLADLENAIDAQAAELESLAERIAGGSPSVAAALAAKLAVLLPAYELRQVPAARFWEQGEPMILVSGAGRAMQHGEDGRFEQDGSLLCRLSRETLTLMRVQPPGTNELTFRTSDFSLAVPGHGAVPADLELDVEALLLEAALLDPDQAGSLARYVHQDPSSNVVKAIRDQQKIAWNIPPPSPSKPQGFPSGVIPSPAAVTWWLGFDGRNPGNPWIPLFLQWQVEWRPSYASYQGVPKALKGWRFQGTDYEAAGSPPRMPAVGARVEVDGANLLTPSPVWHLKRQLEAFLESRPAGSPSSDHAILEEIKGQLEHLDILAQAVGGFQQRLGMRHAELQMPPLNVDLSSGTFALATAAESPARPLTELLDGNYQLGPLPAYDLRPTHPATSTPFFPVRAGTVKIKRLAVVDAFGQVLDLDPPPTPILGPNLRAAAAPDFALLRPRLAQKARLDFRWVSAADPEVESNSDPATSPVIGWIWANELDRSLMLATARGRLLGKFRASADGATVLWVDDPHLPATFTSPHASPAAGPSPTAPSIDPELEQFSRGLMAQTGADFLDFLRYLVETQDQITPPGSRATSPAARLMGSPIALARASLALELDGLPVYDQSSDALGEFNDRGFTGIEFNVALGDLQLPGDGLYGYFTSGGTAGYETFFTAFGETAGLTGSYVKAPPTDPSPVRLTPQPNGSPAAPVLVTLLLDARCPVAAQTGILPRKSIELPAQDVAALLRGHEIFFQVAPVLTSAGDFAIPRPSEEYGAWSWLERRGEPRPGSPGSWRSQWHERTDFGQQTGLSGPPAYPLALAEGWLRLTTPGTAAAAILYFVVLGGRYRVPAGTAVELAWAANVPDGYRLTLAAATPPSPPSSVEPVMTSLPRTISRDTTFELTLVDSHGKKFESRSLTVRVLSSP